MFPTVGLRSFSRYRQQTKIQYSQSLKTFLAPTCGIQRKILFADKNFLWQFSVRGCLPAGSREMNRGLLIKDVFGQIYWSLFCSCLSISKFNTFKLLYERQYNYFPLFPDLSGPSTNGCAVIIILIRLFLLRSSIVELRESIIVFMLIFSNIITPFSSRSTPL